MVGSLSTLRAVWSFADIANALMVIPNVISLFVLTNVVVLETRKYLWKGDINASEIPEVPRRPRSKREALWAAGRSSGQNSGDILLFAAPN